MLNSSNSSLDVDALDIGMQPAHRVQVAQRYLLRSQDQKRLLTRLMACLKQCGRLGGLLNSSLSKIFC